MATERKHGHMKHIWEFYENMNEVVYVSDMDTYEMVYLNNMGVKNLVLHLWMKL